VITLFTGSPGAGKTASLVDFLSKLPGDRPLFVDGLNGLTLPHTVCDANNWHNELPDGAILVIDEVQRVWRPRGAGTKVPESVAQLETHRHRGIDVFVTTQAPRLLDSNVRGLVGRHVHIRDTGILGRYWYEWPESNDSMQWKTCINKKRISLPKKAFSLYKSASIHTTPVRGVPRAMIFGIVALLLFCALAYGVYNIIQRTQNGGKVPSSDVKSTQVKNQNQDSSGQSLQQADGIGPIDDRVAFIPRVSNKPESAPAFDHLRVVAAMPVVTGAACMGAKCKCYTGQGTDAGLSDGECRTWLQNRPFNPYLAPAAPGTVSAGTPPPANPVPPSPSSSETPPAAPSSPSSTAPIFRT
jgi:zona occludens toxin